jgi:ribose transport system substrate-binding protein
MDRHTLLAATTDTRLSALDAIREARREHHMVLVGQDCIAEAIAVMKRRRF